MKFGFITFLGCTVITCILAYEPLHIETRSGKKIPVNAARVFAPIEHYNILSSAILELDAKTLVLSNHFFALNITASASTVDTIHISEQLHTTVRSGDDYTFAFDGRTGHLISAWGPDLQLHPLDPVLYPNIFINTRTIQHLHAFPLNNGILAKSQHRLKTSNDRSDGQPSQNTCVIKSELTMMVFLTKSFSQMFNNDPDMSIQVVHALIHRTSHLLMSTACTEIVVDYIYVEPSVNDPDRELKFQFPNISELDHCEKMEGCQPASYILRKFKYSENEVFDILVLFTGYGVPNSTLVGSAFRRTPCTYEGRQIWIAQHDDVVLAHELGHLLGAEHDEKGIMREVVEYNTPFQFSVNSKAAIQRFVNRDVRSSCLRFFYKKKNWDLYSYPPDRRTYHFQTFVGSVGVISMFGSSDHEYNVSTSEFYYSYDLFEPTSCGPQNLKEVPIHTSSIQSGSLQMFSLANENGMGPFSIAFSSMTSPPLMIVTYRRKFISLNDGTEVNNGYYVLVYRVGFDFNLDTGKSPSKWSSEKKIPLETDYYTYGTAVGHIRGNETEDIIAFYQRNRYGKGLYYKVGFNLSPIGDVLDGWSNEVSVPNRFSSEQVGDQSFYVDEIRLNIIDVDNNGLPDLVVFYQVDFMGARVQSFVQFGLNLDAHGHVTGGWTDLKQFNVFNTMAVGVVPWCTKPLLVGSYIPPVPNNGSRQIVYTLHVNISENLLTAGLPGTVTSHAPLEDVSDACSECYYGLKLQHCKNRRQACKAMVDEVHYSNTYDKLFPTTVRQIESHETRSTILHTNRLEKWPTTVSLYCIGFEFLMRRKGGLCEIIDRERAISKGIEIVMLQEFDKNGFKNQSLIDSFTLFGKPAGVHGNSQPIAAQFALTGKRNRFAQLLKRIFKRLRRRPEFGGLSKDTLKMKKFYSNGKWFIQVKFDTKHTLEAR